MEKDGLKLCAEKIGGDLCGELPPNRLSEQCRFVQRRGRRRLEKLRAIGFEHDRMKRDMSRLDAGVSADRRLAGAIENTQKGPLRCKGNGCLCMENRREESPCGVIVPPHSDGNRALARRRNKLLYIQNGGDAGFEPKAFQASKCQQSTGYFALGNLGETCFDIAAQEADLQIRPQPLDHGAPPKRGGADHASWSKPERMRSVRRNPRVAHIFTRQITSDFDCLRQDRRQILCRVHGGVDIALQQGKVKLLGKKPLAAGFAQRHVKNQVAAGFDRDDLDSVRIEAMRRCEAAHEFARLGERQGAATRPKPERQGFARSRSGRNCCVSYWFGWFYRLKLNAAGSGCQICSTDGQ